jgi:hypothetical protein
MLMFCNPPSGLHSPMMITLQSDGNFCSFILCLQNRICLLADTNEYLLLHLDITCLIHLSLSLSLKYH